MNLRGTLVDKPSRSGALAPTKIPELTVFMRNRRGVCRPRETNERQLGVVGTPLVLPLMVDNVV